MLLTTVEQDNDTLVSACRNLNHAWQQPAISGKFKQQAEDFQVLETLAFEPDGSGEHLFLFIEKTQTTTIEAQQLLSRLFNQPLNKVSYSGMKDKMGITRQWFSVQTGMAFTPAQIPELPAQLRVLQASKNSRKLRIGSHSSNSFRIVIRELNGDLAELDTRVRVIAQQGVPNYFGPQRFGNHCSNLIQAAQWLSGHYKENRRNKRSMLLSAARSFLFNQVLSQRVLDGSWNQASAGDVMALSGSASTFNAEQAEAGELQRRLAEMDIHPTGPLWGKGSLRSSGPVQTLETSIIQRYAQLAAGLEQQGLEQARRPLRLQVQGLKYEAQAKAIVFEFTLPKGAYATAVLRELILTDL